MLDKPAKEYGVQIRTVVEVDLGMNRCGTQPGEPTVALAKEIHSRKGLKFEGMMAWEGHALRIKDIDEKRVDGRRGRDDAAGHGAPVPRRRPAGQHHLLRRDRHLPALGGASTASPRSRPAAASTAIWCTATRSASIIRWR